MLDTSGKIFTTEKTVFDPNILYVGRPIKLTGYTTDGDKVDGYWLIKNVEMDKLEAYKANGDYWSFYLSEFQEEGLNIELLGEDPVLEINDTITLEDLTDA